MNSESPTPWSGPDAAPQSGRDAVKVLTENHADLAAMPQDRSVGAMAALHGTLADAIQGPESPKRPGP